MLDIWLRPLAALDQISCTLLWASAFRTSDNFKSCNPPAVLRLFLALLKRRVRDFNLFKILGLIKAGENNADQSLHGRPLYQFVSNARIVLPGGPFGKL